MGVGGNDGRPDGYVILVSDLYSIAVRTMPILQVLRGDITKVKVDVIVNAANASLMGGGGVDGAIHQAGGPAILEACKEIVRLSGDCATGEAVITTAGALPAKYVIHTVGPVWRGGALGEARKLASCYRNSLRLAEENGCTSIAFPNISTGVYGYPKPEAAAIAVEAVKDYLTRSSSTIQRVIFVCFDHENHQLVDGLLQ